MAFSSCSVPGRTPANWSEEFFFLVAKYNTNFTPLFTARELDRYKCNEVDKCAPCRILYFRLSERRVLCAVDIIYFNFYSFRNALGKLTSSCSRNNYRKV